MTQQTIEMRAFPRSMAVCAVVVWLVSPFAAMTSEQISGMSVAGRLSVAGFVFFFSSFLLSYTLTFTWRISRLAKGEAQLTMHSHIGLFQFSKDKPVRVSFDDLPLRYDKTRKKTLVYTAEQRVVVRTKVPQQKAEEIVRAIEDTLRTTDRTDATDSDRNRQRPQRG